MNTPLALTLTRRLQPYNAVLVDIVLIITGSLFVALMAQIKIFLPFTPVPITGQTFAVLLIGAVYGSKRGAASLILYLIGGFVGLPFFAGGSLFGATGGYLIGFVVAAYIIGLFAERALDRKLHTALLAFLVGTLIIYVFGVAWLATFIGFENAIIKGVLPFLLGDVIKLIAATVALPAAWQLMAKQ